MIDAAIHKPVFRVKRTIEDKVGARYCTLALLCENGSGATIFIENADDARELAKQFDAIADILSGVTQ
jgi:hypothetical protein